MNMDELRTTIVKNLSELRKKRGLTQAELAEQLNYSDKAISKWEHGDAMPSIENLIVICKFYNITLDQLTTEGIENIKVVDEDKQNKNNKIIITALSFFTVWTLATIIYVAIIILYSTYYWNAFVWAIPASLIDLIVFNSIWGKRKRSEEHTSELQSPDHLVCRLLLEKKNQTALARPGLGRVTLTAIVDRDLPVV